MTPVISWSGKDTAGLQSGITAITMATVPGHAGRVTLKARGLRLPMPVSVSRSTLFTQDPSVIVQLVSSVGDCLSAELGTATTNSGTTFAAP